MDDAKRYREAQRQREGSITQIPTARAILEELRPHIARAGEGRYPEPLVRALLHLVWELQSGVMGGLSEELNSEVPSHPHWAIDMGVSRDIKHRDDHRTSLAVAEHILERDSGDD